ncbi:hypothetical protein [Candidatus Nitrosotenuis sp. DW1]|uniref:hypothetical protein n=1 Tax=Candidatus Nitrosotenuis sp. DW1 TaxID=2259672 RepID=UPI0015CC6D0D|nr:hypothetical protein [Candidatus Nitrosotenuis sp. DW1]
MSDRITILLDSDLTKQLRQIQAKMITQTEKSVSFSQVLNLAVKEGLPKLKSKALD